MSTSIYFRALRPTPLTVAERAAIRNIEDSYSVNAQVAEAAAADSSVNWESWCVYDPADPSDPLAVYEGATKLPDDSEESTWLALQHWCRLLSEVRRIVPAAEWHVTVDDHDIAWDIGRNEYDPSQ